MTGALRRIRLPHRLMHLYWRFSRGLTLGARALVIDEAGQVFLVRHGYIEGWHLPGGGIEPGESILEGLARELAEEGGIEWTAPPRLFGLYYNPVHSSRDHVALYVVRDFRRIAEPVRGFEIADFGFFPAADLPEGTTSGTRARIAEVLGGRPPSPRWQAPA